MVSPHEAVQSPILSSSTSGTSSSYFRNEERDAMRDQISQLVREVANLQARISTVSGGVMDQPNNMMNQFSYVENASIRAPPTYEEQ